MATAAGLYRKFGPKILHAIVEIIKDEINILRVREGLAERTDAQLLTAISDKLDTIADYDWMSEE